MPGFKQGEDQVGFCMKGASIDLTPMCRVWDRPSLLRTATPSHSAQGETWQSPRIMPVAPGRVRAYRTSLLRIFITVGRENMGRFRSKRTRVYRPELLLQQLEERIVLDAAVNPAPQDNPTDHPAKCDRSSESH